VIAFVRGGQLWTIDPDGANAFAVVGQGDEVSGYSWSPDHHLLAYRTLDSSFAKPDIKQHLHVEPISGELIDSSGTLNTIGVDGGTPITIAFSDPTINYSTPYWNSDSSRLLYRQTPVNFADNPASANWWIAQNDQPGGIAAKRFPATYSQPSFSNNSQQHYNMLGNSTRGVFTTDITGHLQRTITSVLDGHPLAASLERVLWRPGHSNQSILYALPTPDQSTSDKGSQPFKVQLDLTTIGGPTRTLTQCTCTQFAWSPNGTYVLYDTGSMYTIFNVDSGTSHSYAIPEGSIPYWSPDSAFLLIGGLHDLTLINVKQQSEHSILTDNHQQIASTEQSASGKLPSTSALLQPTENSLWSADSRHFAFQSHQRLALSNGNRLQEDGLYTITIDDQGNQQGSPTLVQQGNDITQVGWTYQDPNTAFLY
jgi:Tol biopolymer transport system component